LLLRRYDTNTALTNHCIVKMLHRVAFDSKLPAMLFQASLFITFRKIMADPRSKSDPTIKVKLTTLNFNYITFYCIFDYIFMINRLVRAFTRSINYIF
jgi:hypothetical protein